MGVDKAREARLADLVSAAQGLQRQAERLSAVQDPPGKQRYAIAADRLRSSVTGPLSSAIGSLEDGSGGAASRSEPSPEDRDPSGVQPDGWEAALWTLARRATELRVGLGRPPELLEAAAALQDLALGLAAGDEDRSRRREQLAGLQAGLPAGIEPEPDGPYLVTNPRRLESWLGESIETTPQMALCRCGQSKLKPLCDGSHRDVGFSDAKDPDRVADRQDVYVGQQITVLDNRGTCQHSGLCTDRLAFVFRLGEEPFVSPSGGRMDEIIRAVRDCPSGALSYALDGVESREEVDFHDRREPTIEVTKDGPYRITGAIPLLGGDGRPMPQNDGASREHYALCRCGQSQNKPLCSGMHYYVDFRDPVPDPDSTPTLFEWCGGLPALTRMTRIFYEKYVPEDPMLAPLFANMSADHPQRVAAWLGEVFGGPHIYSERYGGYPRMLSQHLGKQLKEEWRGRWVALLLQSARDAGLPNDAEFRAAFQAYIEWGSRLAVENSQAGSEPPPSMPMPHWDWSTAAGPPGSRISALAPSSKEPSEPVVLPAEDEPVRYEKHIRHLFRDGDRGSMSFAFDLWAYEDVRGHAPEILERVRNGSMPCDGAWPEEWITTFARWVQTGTPA